MNRVDLGDEARSVRRSLAGEHAGETGTRLPPFIDHHVHLALVNPSGLGAHGIAGVVDLGANPATISRFAESAGRARIAYAGAFLTAPGGYPVGRSWLPEGAAREITPSTSSPADALPDAARIAVDEQAAFGASVIKVALNSDGPVLDLDTLRAIVAAARIHGLPVAAHAEGEGMTRLALDAEIDALVHTPWTEHVPSSLIARAAARQVWISTLAIHEGAGRDTAIDNLSRFREAGGRVVYGTDLGNGDLPVGVNAVEIAGLQDAGFGARGILAALVDPWPAAAQPDDGIATFVPGPRPTAPTDLSAWLARSCVVPVEDLEEIR
ncbi:hypothetical protein MN032_01740 [Agromyces atrinae]|uniref:amidohydrolase family protein n=1 Tax=Agromyces atrinae TaxID=592376 RepID=UPI001F56A4FA|nr:hypothetical protein [Agromyces atrinae]MCI2956400.1 hypothetical protein [Agromyces atrinae]